MCSGCPKRAYFGPAGGRAHRCGDCQIEGDVDVLSSICITCLAFTASYGSTSEGPRRCAGCKLPGDVNKQKRLCRTCFKNRPEYGPTPRKKPTTCEGCRKPGLLHRDSDWLWNVLVTRKPRKGKKKHKILWSEETLREQLWWLKHTAAQAAEKGQNRGHQMPSPVLSSRQARPPARHPAPGQQHALVHRPRLESSPPNTPASAERRIIYYISKGFFSFHSLPQASFVFFAFGFSFSSSSFQPKLGQ
jgi:hypothetical protein